MQSTHRVCVYASVERRLFGKSRRANTRKKWTTEWTDGPNESTQFTTILTNGPNEHTSSSEREDPIRGRIATLELFKPSFESKNMLFITTERHMFCVLSYDAVKGELVTRAMGDLTAGAVAERQFETAFNYTF